jgi:hypothetical protein
MNDFRLENLKFCLLPPHPRHPQTAGPVNAAYRCWKTVWAETLRELDGTSQLFSDDFSRQSFIGALFYDSNCVALGFFRRQNFNLSLAADDSYFKVWPEEAIKKLISDGHDVMVGSNITVDPNFRGEIIPGLQLKNLIVGLMVRTFLETNADVTTGTMRVNKNMHQSASQFGSTLLHTGLRHHHVDVELVAFYRRLLLLKNENSADLPLETLWRNRQDLRELELQNLPRSALK